MRTLRESERAASANTSHAHHEYPMVFVPDSKVMEDRVVGSPVLGNGLARTEFLCVSSEGRMTGDHCCLLSGRKMG
jgi:hypothetical protein